MLADQQSSIFGMCVGLAYIIGAIFGTTAEENLGFRSTCDIVFVYHFILLVLYVTIGEGHKALLPKKREIRTNSVIRRVI